MARGAAVLIIDEDPAIRRLLSRELKSAGYQVADMEPSLGGLAKIVENKSDIVVIDIDSPIYGGPAIIAALRESSPTPLLALSSRGDGDTTVSALESGADDLVLKPFHTGEILARIKNALRRRAREQGKSVHLVSTGLEIDLLHRRVRRDGGEVRLAAKPYEVLRVLAERAGRVRTHQEILRAVWGRRCIGRVEYLRVAIRVLRRQLEPDPTHPRFILTEPRVSYRLEIKRSEARS